MQSLWIGNSLSVMEQLSIASFLANGHEYHLYSYEDIENVPDGTVLKAADQILPESMIFKYRSYPSYAGFSNFFRYKLLLTKGGWWVDTDLVCLRPFVFPEVYVFASERCEGRDIPTTAVIKAPQGSEIMAFNWERCRSCLDPSEAVWGEHGPKLLGGTISQFSMEPFVKDRDVFCPIAFDQWEKFIQPDETTIFGDETYSVHLWNEMWRRGGRDKNAIYPPHSLYEQLKESFLRC
jgi:Glycosyltransferase sugar-binding region containing DXD motif/Alpha 1,4-glycosyltransferase conserved region